ncbi:MAG: protein-disulfide reductase DsbD domain-containing protein, partial [bacterium]
MVSQVVRNSARALLLTLVAGAARSAPGEGESLLGGEYDGTVTARLLADVSEIAPGETFRAGVEISMAEGWHTYWENGGDAGLPTTIAWTLPEGFVAGPILWPVPNRYAEEGDVVTFGYADEVLLLTEITAGPAIPAGET